MARFIFPDEGQRLIYTPGVRRGSALTSAAGLEVTVWTAATNGALADIVDMDDDPIEGSLLTVDEDSLLPQFKGPDGSVTSLWLEVAGSDVRTELHALPSDIIDQDVRLGALAGYVPVVEVDGVFDVAAAVDAGAAAVALSFLSTDPVTIVMPTASATEGQQFTFALAYVATPSAITWEMDGGEIEPFIGGYIDHGAILGIPFPAYVFAASPVATGNGDAYSWVLAPLGKGGGREGVVGLLGEAGVFDVEATTAAHVNCIFVTTDPVTIKMPTASEDDGSSFVLSLAYVATPSVITWEMDGVEFTPITNGTIDLGPSQGVPFVLNAYQAIPIPTEDAVGFGWMLSSFSATPGSGDSSSGVAIIEGVPETIVGTDYTVFEIDATKVQYVLRADVWEADALIRFTTAADADTSEKMSIGTIGCPPGTIWHGQQDVLGGAPYLLPQFSFSLLGGGGLEAQVGVFPESTYSPGDPPADIWVLYGTIPMRDWVPVPSDGTETICEPTAGLLPQTDYIVQPGNGTPFLRIPNPDECPGQDITILSTEGAQAASVYWVDEAPTAGTAILGEAISMAILMELGEGSYADLRTATLGVEYRWGVEVDGVTSFGDPVDDIFGPITVNDEYAELQRLLGTMATVFIAAGCTIDQNTGLITSPTVGFGSSVAFSNGMTMAGIDLDAVMTTTAVDGVNGTVYPGGDNWYGNLDVEELPQYEGYAIIESGIHTHPNMRDLTQRSVHLRSIPAAANGGVVGKWASVTWPIRDSMIQIGGWNAIVANPANNIPSIETLNDLARSLFNVGALVDGNYRLQLTRDSGGTNTIQWVEDV